MGEIPPKPCRQNGLYRDPHVDPESAGCGPEEIARRANVARSTYWEARRDPRFTGLLEGLRDQLLPGWKLELAQRILIDALTPLAESRHPDKLVRTREQAAAIVGLALSPRDS